MAEVEDEVKEEKEVAREESVAGRAPRSGARAAHPLVELTLARIREFLREPEAVFWVFVFPVLLALALGIAFRNTAPDKARIAIESSGPEAEYIINGLSKSSEVNAVVLSPEEAAKSLRTGKIDLIVRVNLPPLLLNEIPKEAPPVSAGAQPATDSPPPARAIEYRYDPTRPESRVARLAADDALQRVFGRKDAAEVNEEKVTEPGARYIDFLIPGLVGLNLMGSGMWGLGFTVVQARTRKLLKRLAATPMRRSHFLLSFMLSRLVFLAGEVAAVIIFAWLVFGVSVNGSIADLTIIALIGSMTFAGLGLLVAARPKTIEGVSGWMNLVMLPMWLLSGTFFSAARFPDFAQPFIKALPLTALNNSLRAVMNEGMPIASTWQEIAVLIAWGLVSFAVALKIFRWQ
ncbi:MAG TPA: ABC transporter permease [Blastocatellia bacterium]|nr:ABC transporter permease [Blastocatellia bacterium]